MFSGGPHWHVQVHKHTSNDPLLLELNWLPLRQRRTNHTLVMLYTIIDEVNSTKLLGVNVDNTLSWTMQVAQVKKCTSYRLFLFRTIRKCLPLETRIKYYDYYVKPLIEYCSSVWGICSKENQTKIIKIQTKAARLILEAPPLTPSKQMFQQLKWLPFNEIVKFRQVSLVYKAVNGNAPQNIQTMFTNIKDNSNYSLRSSAQ